MTEISRQIDVDPYRMAHGDFAGMHPFGFRTLSGRKPVPGQLRQQRLHLVTGGGLEPVGHLIHAEQKQREPAEQLHRHLQPVQLLGRIIGRPGHERDKAQDQEPGTGNQGMFTTGQIQKHGTSLFIISRQIVIRS